MKKPGLTTWLFLAMVYEKNISRSFAYNFKLSHNYSFLVILRLRRSDIFAYAKVKGNNTLAEFRNEAGSIARGYRLVSGDIYGLTAECFEGTPAKGNVVELMAGTKLKTAVSATEGSTVVGKIVDVEGKYFVVEIA